MKTILLTLFTAFTVITLINTTEVWILAMLAYSILILVLRRDLDLNSQHNRIKGLQARIEQLKIDRDCLGIQCDKYYRKEENDTL